MNDDNNEEKKFEGINNYLGGIIGGLVALILCFTKIYVVLVYAVIVVAGIIVGNYIQKNKSKVKQSLKDIIDKI